MRFMPTVQTSNLLFAGCDSITWAFSWDRESSYGALETPTVQALFEEPDTIYSIYQMFGQRIMRYSLSTDAKHNMWLSTEAAPAAAPNTGFFFNPAWYLMGYIGGAVNDRMDFNIVTEVTVQCRGYKNPR